MGREQGSTPRPPELNENPSLRIREKLGHALGKPLKSRNENGLVLLLGGSCVADMLLMLSA